MKQCQRSLTLRQYLENYQQLKKCQSDKNFSSVLRPSQPTLASTPQLQAQIGQKIEFLKKILKQINTAGTEISPLDCLYELEKIITQVLQKVKSFEDHGGSIKNIEESTATAPNRITRKLTLQQNKVKSEKLKRLKSHEIPHTQLMSPKQMPKQIELSKDLSNLNLSSLITTQDLTMKQNVNKLVEKSRALGESTSSQTYFKKRIQKMKSLGPDLEDGEEATADEYQIRVMEEVDPEVV